MVDSSCKYWLKMMIKPFNAHAVAVSDLRSTMQGQVVTPTDEGYEEKRKIWNGAISLYPSMLAICETVHDVQAAVNTVRKHGLPVSVLVGGYGWTGQSLRDEGVVIDLSAMNQVVVDVQSQTAIVQGGATAGDVVSAAAEFGLTAVVGTMAKIGMAGFTLAGGYGPLTPHFGLGLDNLLGAELVVPDGRCLRVSATENADLFWALRGGGGNVGVVTSMRIRLHQVEQVLAGKIVFPWSDARSVLTGFAAAMASAPDELATTAAIVSTPNGDPAIVLAPCWSGDLHRGKAFIDALTHFGSPTIVNVGPMPCDALFSLFEGSAPKGRHYAQQTRWLGELTADTITRLIESGDSRESPLSALAVQSFHGVPSRIPLHATSFGLRRRHFLTSIIAAWDESDDQRAAVHRTWARNASEKLSSSALPGGYPNLLGPDERSQIDLSYGENTSRLLDIKRHFDPENVFNATPLPQSVG
jgi:FAD/FMN-containing dehydrogenase